MRAFVVAEFEAEEPLLAAARTLRARGARELDLHSPVPLHGADEALGLTRSIVPKLALVGGLIGAATGVALQVGTVGILWPINVGNRPPISGPAFVPITFELAVLISSFAIFFGMFALWGLPRLHHPVHEVEGFRPATVDGLWLSAAAEPGEAEALAAELRGLGASRVAVIPEAA